MPLVKITRSGLVAIGCSVAVLWGCILGERITMQRAYAERAAVMRRLAPRRQTEPVVAPVYPSKPPRHFVVG
jgi:putative protein kinase ArgK-like GTPase of G3E family